MHHLALVIIPEYDPDHVDKLMRPYQEHDTEDGGYEGWWDWYSIGGRWDGRVEGNWAPVPDVAEMQVFTIVEPDGAFHHVIDWNVSADKDPEWAKKTATILMQYRDHVAVVVDYHS